MLKLFTWSCSFLLIRKQINSTLIPISLLVTFNIATILIGPNWGSFLYAKNEFVVGKDQTQGTRRKSKIVRDSTNWATE